MSEATSNQAGSPKLLGLEIIRFTCAMAVLVWHYQHFAMVGDGRLMLAPHSPLGWLLAPFYRFGLFGVQIFWCISGFIFYWKYAAALAARTVEAKRFFWLRFSRLYPLHFVTLMFVAALQPVYASFAGRLFVYDADGPLLFLLQLFLADQWAGPLKYSFNGPIWSVSAEVFVYMAFFLLLRAVGRSPWLIVGAMALGMSSMWSNTISPALVCGAYFFAGGAAAEAFKEQARRRQYLYAAVGLVAAAVASVPFLDLANRESPRIATWLLVVTPPLLFIAAQDWRRLERWQWLIQAGGNLTYSTYLIHFPLQLVTVTLLLALGIAPPVDQAWFLLAYLAASIILGRIVFTRFEAPMQRIIRATTLARPKEAVTA